jgi:tetratricopeptide (TPR) repeat protein
LFSVALLAALSAAWWGCASAATRGGDTERVEEMPAQELLAFLRARAAAGEIDAEGYFQLGNVFYEMDQLDSAIVYYGHALESDSTFSKAWVNMGLAYDSQRQSAAAQRAFNQALEVNPRDVLAMCHLGFTYFSSGNTDRAIELYMKALAIDPNSAQAHYNLGLAFADAKIFHEALLEWQKVIELDDGNLGKTAAENVELIKTYMELDE